MGLYDPFTERDHFIAVYLNTSSYSSHSSYHVTNSKRNIELYVILVTYWAQHPKTVCMNDAVCVDSGGAWLLVWKYQVYKTFQLRFTVCNTVI